MKYRILPLLALASVFLGVGPAHAYWEYARWGMTEAQLAAAGKGRVQSCSPDIPVCRSMFTDFKPKSYVDGLTILGLPAAAAFGFDDQGKLNHTVVRFGGEAPNLLRLSEALGGVYGLPVARDGRGTPTTTWRDTKKGSQVVLWDFSPRLLLVDYRPAAAGL